MSGSSNFCLTFSRRASNSALDPWMKQRGAAGDKSYQKINSPPVKQPVWQKVVQTNQLHVNEIWQSTRRWWHFRGRRRTGWSTWSGICRWWVCFLLTFTWFRLACLWGWLIGWTLFMFNPKPTLTLLLFQALLSVVHAGAARSIIVIVLLLLNILGSKTGCLAIKGDVWLRWMGVMGA